MREPPPPDLERAYLLTPKGTQQLKGASTALAENALRLLVLIDGKLPLARLAKHLQGVSAPAFGKLASTLVFDGYIQPVGLSTSAKPAAENGLGAVDVFAHEEPPAGSPAH